VTDATVYANVMVQFRNADLNYATKDKIAKANINIYGRITTLTRRSVNWFEDTVTHEIPVEMLPAAQSGSQVYAKRIPLLPGTYRLNVVAKDLVGNTMNTFEMPLNVPSYDAETLGASNVILADQLEHVPTNVIGTGEFVIRGARVRPRMNDVFKQSETMGIYTELYNFGMDSMSKKAKGLVEYQIVNNADDKTVVSYTEDLSDPKAFPNSSPFLVTVQKKFSLKDLAPGRYTLKMTVEDKLRKQTITPSAQFTVTGS